MVSLPGISQTISGFTVTELGFIHMLGARTVEFFHTFSGARLLYIQNDDRELGFNLIYRTPQADETDANHILEHLLLSSCNKYPSRDVFFDMDSKSFSTFMNGLTDNTYTCYPICTQSQEQLIKLMDVYLCCMEAPDALKDKNYFLREGLRLELDRAEGPLSIQGTVLSEDFGHLTDILENADSATAKALYPDQLSSHLLGRLHFHYKELTFEHVKKAYEQCYHYSNCLMVLYGSMDYRAVLDFLDREHLSLWKDQKQSMLPLMNQAPARGHRCLTAKSPAYEGSPKKQAAVIDYALDLSDSTQEELVYWDLFADLLDNDTSPIHRCARDGGINNVMEVYLDLLLPNPSLRFRLRNGDKKQMDAFRSAVREGLGEISTHGIDSSLFEAAMKENRLSDALTREGSHLGYNISEEIGRYWSQTGKTGYFQLYEAAAGTFSLDRSQSILKKLAARALNPSASALVATIPCPGMAEALEREKEEYLIRHLDSLDMEKRKRLCEETAAFRRWNAKDWGNGDFLISPRDLPAPSPGAPFDKKHFGSLTSYTSPAPVEGVGCYQIYFDLSLVPQDQLPYLSLYQLLLSELDTDRYTSGQQKTMEQEYLHDCTFDELFPNMGPGRDSHPMMVVSWYALTEDFPESLDFLLDMMGGGKYGHVHTIMKVLEKYLPDYDLSQADMASSLSSSLAEGYIRQDYRFKNMVNSQEVYYFLKNLLERLKEVVGDGAAADDEAGAEAGHEAGAGAGHGAGAEAKAEAGAGHGATAKAGDEAGAEVTCALKRISTSILGNRRIIFMAAAHPGALPEIEQAAVKRLGMLGMEPSAPQPAPHALPTQDHKLAASADAPAPQPSPYILPPQKKRLAVCIDAPAQETRMIGDFRGNGDFKGRHLPFLMACADKYLKPALRYQGQAYDCGIDFYLPGGYFTLWSTADPQVKSTLELFSNAGNGIMDISLTRQDLDGYILNAYAQAMPPEGTLDSHMRYMVRDMAGLDTKQILQMTSDIKNARLEDQAGASRIIQSLLEQGPFVTVGNKRVILKNKECFDEITQYLHK